MEKIACEEKYPAFWDEWSKWSECQQCISDEPQNQTRTRDCQWESTCQDDRCRQQKCFGEFEEHLECHDIDECQEGVHLCGSFACTNTKFGYTCDCGEGYQIEQISKRELCSVCVEITTTSTTTTTTTTTTKTSTTTTTTIPEQLKMPRIAKVGCAKCM